MLSQKSHGIHFRLWSRAFIISDAAVDDKKSRVVFVNIDTGASPQILKIRVSLRIHVTVCVCARAEYAVHRACVIFCMQRLCVCLLSSFLSKLFSTCTFLAFFPLT